MKKEQLDNLTKGSRPSLHPCTPNWETLKGLVACATDSIADAGKKTNSAPTRFEQQICGTRRPGRCRLAERKAAEPLF